MVGALLAAPLSVNAEETSFTIGTARDLQLGAQLGMAKHKGFFEEEGLDITVAYFGSGAEMTSAMAAGQMHVGSFGDFPTVAMIAADLPVKIVAVQAEISGTQQIVVREGITQPADLKGKKLGLLVGSSAESLLRSTLSHFDVPADFGGTDQHASAGAGCGPRPGRHRRSRGLAAPRVARQEPGEWSRDVVGSGIVHPRGWRDRSTTTLRTLCW